MEGQKRILAVRYPHEVQNSKMGRKILEQFYPNEYQNSTYEIDFERFYKQGMRGVIFDIDNTLVPHDAPADGRAVSLFERLHGIGYRTMLLSNNKEPRVKSFAEAVKSDYLHKAGKPGRTGYLGAIRQMKTTPQTTLFVGDQLFTDIWGARRSNIYAVLVKPIHQKEEIQIVLKRYLEKIILYFYGKEFGKYEN